ncbi:hypothetical protein [Endothiovibrio diazotrophicus]
MSGDHPLREQRIAHLKAALALLGDGGGARSAIEAELALLTGEERMEPPALDGVAVRDLFRRISGELAAWPSTLAEGTWLERPELETLIRRIAGEEPSSTLLLGGPGSGKSALLARLTRRLMESGVTVLGIKADRLPVAANAPETLFGEGRRLPADPARCLRRMAEEGPTVLVIDQLDALAELVDRHSDRLSRLLDLIHACAGLPNLHLVASCRTFEQRHDPRLRAIDADPIHLEPPPWEPVSLLLQQCGIDARDWPEDVREALRVPQNLKIYLEVMPPEGERRPFTGYHQMLDELWRLKITPWPERAAMVERLAVAIGESEELWQPAARYDGEPAVVERLLAEGVLIRDPDGHRIGFVHQTLFDYARARAFVTREGLLSDYVLDHQDGLFVRPRLWSALHYLRNADRPAYRREFEALWRNGKLRAHLRGLLIEFLGQLPDPDDVEAAWLLPLLDEPATRDRALAAMAGSRGWFERLAPAHMPVLMRLPEGEAYRATYVLGEALSVSRETVLELLERHWLPDATRDGQVLQVLWNLESWNERAVRIVETLFGRNGGVYQHYVEKVLEGVSEAFPEAGVRLAEVLLRRRLDGAKEEVLTPAPPVPEEEKARIAYFVKHDRMKPLKELLEGKGFREKTLVKVANRIPLVFLEQLLPWLIEVLDLIEEIGGGWKSGGVYWACGYSGVRLDGDVDRHHPCPAADALDSAVKALAESNWRKFSEIQRRYDDSSQLLVQRLFARGMTVGAETHGQEVLGFLLGDRRRFTLGNPNGDSRSDTHGLIDALVPHLSDEQLGRLETAIWEWERYTAEEFRDADLGTRRRCLDGAREYRLYLLDHIPRERMSAEGRRRFQGEERRFPRFRERTYGVQVCDVARPIFVGQMEKATDEELLKLFSKLNDDTGFRYPAEKLRGGGRPLAQEFKEFAKTYPQRAAELIRRFEPGINEVAVGHGLRGMEEGGYPPKALAGLVVELVERGFSSPEFRHDTAYLFQYAMNNGFSPPDRVLEIWESWLEEIKPVGEDDYRIDDSHDEMVESNSILWRQGGYISSLPGGNFPLLDALSHACLAISPPEVDRWLTILDAHLGRRELPEVWAAIMHRTLACLSYADMPRVETFMQRLFDDYPTLFENGESVLLLAGLHRWLREEKVHEWMDRLRVSGGRIGRQGYGELLAFRHLAVDDEWAAERIDALLKGGAETVLERVGVAHTVVQGWREVYRRKEVLELIRALATLDEAPVNRALSNLLWAYNGLIADKEHWRLVDLLSDEPHLLQDGETSSFIEALEPLTPTEPGRVWKLCCAFVRQIAGELVNHASRHALAEEPIARIAMLLQRLGPPHRLRGLELFEALLEREGYGVSTMLKTLDRKIR